MGEEVLALYCLGVSFEALHRLLDCHHALLAGPGEIFTKTVKVSSMVLIQKMQPMMERVGTIGHQNKP